MQPFGRNGMVARLTLVVLLAVSCVVPSARAQQPAYSENEVKAAFLFHFGTYVEWGTPPVAGDPITIAVLGAPGVVEQLERFLPDRVIQDRPVAVRALAAIDDLSDDEILFIGRELNDRLPALIEAVAGRRTLIVTDAEDGLDQGAMVNFQLVDQRLRFEISLPAAQNAGLSLSSRLLSAALRVETVDCWIDCHRYAAPPGLALHGDRPQMLRERRSAV